MANRTAWKREFELLADRTAASILAWERAKRRGESVDQVLSAVIRVDVLNPAADLLGVPRMKERG